MNFQHLPNFLVFPVDPFHLPTISRNITVNEVPKISTPINQLPITDTFDPDTDTVVGTVYTDGTPFTMQVPGNLIGGGGGFTATKCISNWAQSWDSGSTVSVSFVHSEGGTNINTAYAQFNVGDDQIEFLVNGNFMFTWMLKIHSNVGDATWIDIGDTSGSIVNEPFSETTHDYVFLMQSYVQSKVIGDLYTPYMDMECPSGNDVHSGNAELVFTVEYLGVYEP